MGNFGVYHTNSKVRSSGGPSSGTNFNQFQPISNGLKTEPPLVSGEVVESIIDPLSNTQEPLNDGVAEIFDGNKLSKEVLLKLVQLRDPFSGRMVP